MLMVGAGDIGRRVLAKLKRHDQVIAATSTPPKRPALKRLGAQPVLADLDKRGTLKRLPRDWQVLLHCAPPQSYLTRDVRTRNLLAALSLRNSSRGPAVAPRAYATARSYAAARSDATTRSYPNANARCVVYLSTSGVYGDCGGARITEAQPLKPNNARARRRADAERMLTRAAKRGAFRLVILRVPGIYAHDRLPLARLKAGTPALLPEQDVYTNHIHAADLAAITLAAIRRVRRRRRPQVRVYHASDDSNASDERALRMGDYFDLVAAAFGLPRPPRLPRAQLDAALSPLLRSFMSESRRLDNTRMKRELRIRLQFGTVAEGVAAAAKLLTSQA